MLTSTQVGASSYAMLVVSSKATDSVSYDIGIAGGTAQSKSPNPFSESALIKSAIPCACQKIHASLLEVEPSATHFWHVRGAIRVFDIAERHLCALMFIDS